jgi:hypothetical protein
MTQDTKVGRRHFGVRTSMRFQRRDGLLRRKRTKIGSRG